MARGSTRFLSVFLMRLMVSSKVPIFCLLETRTAPPAPPLKVKQRGADMKPPAQAALLASGWSPSPANRHFN